MEVTIKIVGLESLATAISSLADAISGKGQVQQAPVQQPIQQTPVQQPMQQNSVQQPIQQAPVQQPVQQPIQQAPVQQNAMQQAPVQQPIQQAPVQQPVPTTETSYTLDDLARAAMPLADSGRLAELQQLLARFGVEALPVLPPQQYGAFATALREMGAQI